MSDLFTCISAFIFLKLTLISYMIYLGWRTFKIQRKSKKRIKPYILFPYKNLLVYEEILLLGFGVFCHHLLKCINIGLRITATLSLLCPCLKIPWTFLTYLGSGNECVIDPMSAQTHSQCVDLSLTS